MVHGIRCRELSFSNSVTGVLKISNTDGILMNTDAILSNTDGILTNTDGILTLPRSFVRDRLALGTLLHVPLARKRPYPAFVRFPLGVGDSCQPDEGVPKLISYALRHTKNKKNQTKPTKTMVLFVFSCFIWFSVRRVAYFDTPRRLRKHP